MLRILGWSLEADPAPLHLCCVLLVRNEPQVLPTHKGHAYCACYCRLCLQERADPWIEHSTHRRMEAWDHEETCQTRYGDSVQLWTGREDTRPMAGNLAWVWEVAHGFM